MVRQRNKLGGFYPERRPVQTSAIMELPPPETYTVFDKGNPKSNNSTTMSFAVLLRRLMKSGEFGKRVVLHLSDEARTFV
jgi:pyruvate dehydrogenase E1 component